MAFTFPDPIEYPQFEAPNGINYKWDDVDEKWVVVGSNEIEDKLDKPYVTYFSDIAPIEGQGVHSDGTLRDGELWYSTLTLELFCRGSGAWWPTAIDYGASIDLINTKLGNLEETEEEIEGDVDILQAKVAELEVTKGSIAKYTLKSTTFANMTLDGEFSVDNANTSGVTKISFSPFDNNGNSTKTVVAEDVVEFVYNDQTIRYTVTSGDSNDLTVTFNNGDYPFVVDGEYDVYIYPRNSNSASVDYVEDNFLSLDVGGEVHGYIDFKNAKTSGPRWFSSHGSHDKLASMWEYTQDELRIRIEPEKRLNITGYPYHSGHTSERSLIKWEIDKGLMISHLSDPSYDDNPVSLGYANDNYLKLTGGTIKGKLTLDRLGDEKKGFTIKGRQEDGNIGELLNVYHNGGGVADGINYRGHTTSGTNIQTKDSVLGLISSTVGIPVGSIVMWMGSSPPAGWMFCRGSNFSISKYPKLHAYLQDMHGYTSGFLPDFRGMYPGAAGAGPANLTPDKAGYTHDARTGQPSGGPPSSTNTNIPNGSTRGFSAAGNTNAYSAGAGSVSISEGWDSVTRPPTIAVNFIIKHD